MPKIIIIGSGIVGLWTAEILSSQGYEVTIVSKASILDTCSSAASCIIAPLFPTEWNPTESKFKKAWSQYLRTIKKVKSLESIGVQKGSLLEALDCYEFGFQEDGEYYLEKGFNIKGLKNVPFTNFETVNLNTNFVVENHLNEFHNCSFYTKYVADFCNTEIFINHLVDVLKSRNVKFVNSKIENLEDINKLNAEVIFNCMGYESGQIFKDNSLYFVRGQSIFIEQFNINGPFFGIASGNHAVFRHKNGYYVGSYFLEELNPSNLPNKTEYDLSLRFVKNHYPQLCKTLGFDVPAINLNSIRRVNSGIRPFRTDGPRIDFELIKSTNDLKIIHNYGHGAHGWTIGYGCAEDSVILAQSKGWLEKYN